ncbi:uncharacterized protein LOC114528323 [Dendronephthya gigantea]|uniref:uncharacterized protein LOC114528323 n=1 Tax=Dendronephthya gigantea TaxID=151771 RepID=UPI00106BD467|nr:uncharacterized protein LOC114528323 [Dendronephthya gigantea]
MDTSPPTICGKIIYKSGANNPADYLSRHPTNETQSRKSSNWCCFLKLSTFLTNENLSNLYYDGKRVKWNGDLNLLKQITSETFRLDGKWSSPGGKRKKFVSSNTDLSFTWCPDKQNSLIFQGNAMVERFMQPLGKALKTAKLEERPWKQELYRFLLQYRTTPHCTTGVPSSKLLFNRIVKGKIPVITRRKVMH